MLQEKILFFKFKLNKKIIKFLKKFRGLFVLSRIARNLYKKYLDDAVDECENFNLQKLNDILENKISQGYCIAVLAAGTGDTLIFFENKKLIEKIHNIKLFPVVREDQKVIPLIYGEKDFIALNSASDILFFPIVKKLYPKAKKINDIGAISPYMEKSKIFMAHTNYIPQRIPEAKKINTFGEFVKYLYSMPDNTALEFNHDLGFLNSSKTVLLSPEKRCPDFPCEPIPNEFWTAIAKHYFDKGYNVIYNSFKKNKELDKYALRFDGSLDLLLYLSLRCEKIYSVRSGYCDLCKSLDKKINVIYPSKVFYEYFSINKMYNTNINEVVWDNNLSETLEKTLGDDVLKI